MVSRQAGAVVQRREPNEGGSGVWEEVAWRRGLKVEGESDYVTVIGKAHIPKCVLNSREKKSALQFHTHDLAKNKCGRWSILVSINPQSIRACEITQHSGVFGCHPWMVRRQEVAY